MAQTLDNGHFVTVVANQHTGYGANRCIFDLVDRYLINLEVPASGTVCE
jgi:hypothetical protein